MSINNTSTTSWSTSSKKFNILQAKGQVLVSVRYIALLVLAACVMNVLPGSAAKAACIDYYGDYLHLAGSVDTPGSARCVAVQGDYAYVAATTSGLQVVDITTPELPVIVGGVDTPDCAHGVAVQGNYAYVADRYSGLQVVDITTPELPVIVGGVDTPSNAYDVFPASNVRTR